MTNNKTFIFFAGIIFYTCLFLNSAHADAPPDLDIVPLGYPLEGEVKEGASEEDLPVLVQESQEPFINNGGREKKT